MAKFKIGDGIDNYIDNIENLMNATDEMIGRSIYQGAKIVTDRIRTAIENVPIDNRIVKEGDTPLKGLATLQKKGLLDGLGISRKQTEGDYVNVKVGFDGYNGIITKRWTQGQPNSMVARSMESGTSFRAKNPVISKATRASKAEAEKAMADEFDRILREKIGG